MLDKFYKDLLYSIPLAKEEMVLVGMIDRIIETGRRFGLDMNVESTKIMVTSM